MFKKTDLHISRRFGCIAQKENITSFKTRQAGRSVQNFIFEIMYKQLLLYLHLLSQRLETNKRKCRDKGFSNKQTSNRGLRKRREQLRLAF